MNNLDKYSLLCKNWIQQNTKQIINIKDMKNSQILQNIINIVKSTYKNDNTYSVISTTTIKKVHDLNQYPLFYLFYQGINNINATSESFDEFLNWHRNIGELKYSVENLSDEMELLYSLIYRTKGTRSKLHQLLYENPFVSIDIQQHAETNDMTYVVYKTEMNDNIHIYYIDDAHKPNINLITCIINMMRQIAELLTKTKVNKPVNLTIFAGLQKKIITQINHKDKRLYPENINSGSSNGININIWRYEELNKVLIHELIHYFEIDFYIADKNYLSIEKFIQNNYCVSGIDRSNESFTETLAIIIHSILMSEYLSMDLSSILHIEATYSLFQVFKILSLFGIKDIKDVYKTDSCVYNVTQNTSVFSYYIIKCAMLINIDLFLEYLETNIPVKNNIKNYNNLLDTIMSNFKTIYENKSMSSLFNKSENEYINNNMRMSCISV
jgi:hypothetical protein